MANMNIRPNILPTRVQSTIITLQDTKTVSKRQNNTEQTATTQIKRNIQIDNFITIATQNILIKIPQKCKSLMLLL